METSFLSVSLLAVVFSLVLCVLSFINDNFFIANALVFMGGIVMLLITGNPCLDIAMAGDNYHGLYMFSEYLMHCNKSPYLVCVLLPVVFFLLFATVQIRIASRVKYCCSRVPVLATIAVIGLAMVVCYNHRLDGTTRYAGHIIGVVVLAVVVPTEMIVIVFRLYSENEPINWNLDKPKDKLEWLTISLTACVFAVFLSYWSNNNSLAVALEYVWIILLGILLIYHVNKPKIDKKTSHPYAFYSLLFLLFASSMFYFAPTQSNLPNGWWQLSNGTKVWQNGTVVHPDGTISERGRESVAWMFKPSNFDLVS